MCHSLDVGFTIGKFNSRNTSQWECGRDNRSTGFRNISGNELIQILKSSFSLQPGIVLKKIPFRNEVNRLRTQAPPKIRGIVGRYKFGSTFSLPTKSMSSIIVSPQTPLIKCLKYRRAYSDDRYIHSNTRAARQATKT